MSIEFESLLENKSSRYEVGRKLGEGSFGEVRQGIDRQTGEKVALKFIRIVARESSTIPKAVVREMESLRHLRSPSICNLVDVYPDESSLVLVLEYLDTNLGDFISNLRGYLNRSQFKSCAYMILDAVCHCHLNNIIHRDIKPSNILMASNGQLKLGDFGLARIYDPNCKQSMSHQVFTRWYRPPELLYASRQTVR